MKNISITDDLHRQLKLRAVQDGRHMNEVVEWLILRWLTGDVTVKVGGKDVTDRVKMAVVEDPPDFVMETTINPTGSRETTIQEVVHPSPSVAKLRKMPDLSKTAQAKGKMGR